MSDSRESTVRISLTLLFNRHGHLHAGKPHRFRHTFATWAIRGRARELDAPYLLGHLSPR